MKLSKSQRKELTVWEYFIPSSVAWDVKTDEDIKAFFEWSQQGKHKDALMVHAHTPEGRTYFHALAEGKRWAGINMGLFEEGVLDGTMPYFTILGGNERTAYKKWWQFWKPKYWFENDPVPREVIDFIKKEMFKGTDSETIEKCYISLSA